MNTAQHFASYCAAVRRYASPALVSKYYSELLAMFRCGVSPVGAATHLFFIHNR